MSMAKKISQILQSKPWLMPVILAVFLAFYLSPLLKPNTLPGDPGDVYAYLWLADWFCPNFFQNNFINTTLFALTPIDLSGGYVAPFLYTLGCPFKLISTTAMLKAMYLLQIVALFAINYFVAKHWFKSSFIQLSFIFLYSFSGFYLLHSGQHLDLISTLWVASLGFYLFNKLDLTSQKQVIVAGIFLGIAFTSSWQNIPNLFPLVAILSFLAWKRLKPQDRHSPKLATNLTLGALAFFLIFLPLAYPMISYQFSGPEPASMKQILNFNSNLSSYIIPLNFLESLFDSLIKARPNQYFALEGDNPIDLAVLYLFVVLFAKSFKQKFHRYKHVLLLLLVYLFLSFGNNLSLLGRPQIPLPYFSILESIPPFSFSRTPGRYSVYVTFFILYLTFKLLDRIPHPRSRSLTLIALLPIYALLSTTLLSSNLQLPHHNPEKFFPSEILAQMHQSNSKGVVLNLPVLVGVDQYPLYMQLHHQLPTLNNYISRAIQTEATLKPFSQNQVLSSLNCSGSAYDFTSQDLNPISNQDLQSMLSDLNISFITIRQSLLKSPNCQTHLDLYQQLITLPNVSLLGKTDSIAIYQVNSN